MTTHSDSRHIVSSFLAARNSRSDSTAVDLMAPTFTLESPLMRFDDRRAYLESHRAFQAFVKGVTIISELYAATEATLLYDLKTATPAGTQRTAEHFRIEGGKIASIVIVFDSAPWRPLFEATGTDTQS